MSQKFPFAFFLFALVAVLHVSSARADDQAGAGIRISDGNHLQPALNEDNCWVTEKRNDDKHWLDVRVRGGAGEGYAFEFRRGEEYGRLIEVLMIVLQGLEPYRVLSPFDLLELELQANIDSWSPEQIASHDEKLDAADGAANPALERVSVTVDGETAAAYFDNDWATERFPTPRAATVEVFADNLPVGNDGAQLSASIALAGTCRVMPTAE